MKFALEGIKLLFILNGAASVSILTFVGNLRIGSLPLVLAMVSFSIGAAMTVPRMLFGYLAQLHYGNASQGSNGDSTIWRTAQTMHYWAYAFIGLGILAFCIGIGIAAYGLLHIPIPTDSILPVVHK
jgi:hypothetical protein